MISELPTEVNRLVFQYLGPSDLLRLRSVSRKWMQKVQKSPIWCDFYREYYSDNWTIEPFAVHDVDYFQEFMVRYRMDVECVGFFMRLEGVSAKECFQAVSEFLSHQWRDEYLNVLMRLVSEQSLALSVRAVVSEALKWVWCRKANGYLKKGKFADLEETCLYLSMYDQTFSETISHRRKVFAEIRRMRLDDGDDCQKMMQIIGKFHSLVRSARRATTAGSECMSLGRVYGGEVAGHPFVLRAIYQKLGRIFNIQSVPTTGALVVVDSATGSQLFIQNNDSNTEFYVSSGAELRVRLGRKEWEILTEPIHPLTLVSTLQSKQQDNSPKDSRLEGIAVGFGDSHSLFEDQKSFIKWLSYKIDSSFGELVTEPFETVKLCTAGGFISGLGEGLHPVKFKQTASSEARTDKASIARVFVKDARSGFYFRAFDGAKFQPSSYLVSMQELLG